MPRNSVSLGEVIRLQTATREDIAGLRTDIHARPTMDQVNEKMEAAKLLQEAKDLLQDAALKDIQEELGEFKASYASWTTWAARGALGFVGLAVGGLVVIRPG